MILDLLLLFAVSLFAARPKIIQRLAAKQESPPLQKVRQLVRV